MERLDVSTIVKIKHKGLDEVFVQVNNRYFVEDSIYDDAGIVIYIGHVVNKPEYSSVQFKTEDIMAVFHPGETRITHNREEIKLNKEQ